jgi:uncharacterized damage-inducible protein DinB
VNKTLQTLLSSLEIEREKLMDSLAMLSSEKLNSAPAGKWSIAQIVAHLITAERLSIQYMQKKIQGIEQAGDAGIVEEGKLIVLIISQRLPLRFNAPKLVKESTPTLSTLPELTAQWDSVRSDLKQLLEKIPDHLVKRKIYKHVFAGKLNSRQALIFFREHFIHHLPQIQRLTH